MKQPDRRSVSEMALHPFLIAAYSVLALLAANIEEVKAVVALRALFAALAVAGLLLVGLRALLKDSARAAALTSLLLGLFFSYGHVYDYLERTSLWEFNLGRHRFLGLMWFLLAAAATAAILRRKNGLRSLTSALNLIGLVLLVFPLLTIGQWAARSANAPVSTAQATQAALQLHAPTSQPLPDVYYIILDGYSRDDILKTFYELDNSSFISDLEQSGFYVARCSQSNYAQTQLSLASSLNLNYVQALDSRFQGKNSSRVGLETYIQHSAVRQAFESLGYRTIAFETGYKFSQLEDAAEYYSPQANTLDRAQLQGGLNSFEVLYLRTTAVLLAADTATLLPRSLQPALENPRREHRERILYSLEELQRLPQEPGPKFVFAHLVIPHPPHVFGPNGEYVNFDKSEVTGYRGQVAYLNHRILPILQTLIADSTTPPIVIIQGDHAGINTPPAQRTAILNAYFLPGTGSQELYESVSPVNSFRIIFRHYFGADLDLLPDNSYYSVYQTPFEFTPIQNERRDCASVLPAPP